MQHIKLQQKVGRDGILHLEIPTGLPDRELDITIAYQPSTIEPTPPLAQLYGICADHPIAIDTLGISEALDDDLTGAFD